MAPADLTAIAAALKTPPLELLDRYEWAEGTAQRPGEAERYTLLLRMRPRCPFQDDAGRCTVHAVRPQACRDFAAGSSQCHAVQEEKEARR